MSSKNKQNSQTQSQPNDGVSVIFEDEEINKNQPIIESEDTDDVESDDYGTDEIESANDVSHDDSVTAQKENDTVSSDEDIPSHEPEKKLTDTVTNETVEDKVDTPVGSEGSVKVEPEEAPTVSGEPAKETPVSDDVNSAKPSGSKFNTIFVLNVPLSSLNTKKRNLHVVKLLKFGLTVKAIDNKLCVVDNIPDDRFKKYTVNKIRRQISASGYRCVKILS